MIKKVITKEPVFENVHIQVGEREEITYITSDGEEFKDEESAEYHEFYYVKVKRRHFHTNYINIFNFQSWEDMKKYIDDYGYNIKIHNYNKDELVFPNTYVLEEEDVPNLDYGLDEYGQPEEYVNYLNVYTFDQFKEKVIMDLEYLR